ncbi:hypothetical protein C1I98_02890 [Spongiactinospora gelatinilytica]|uniref:Uncharacterized protein n=1 Tax=Spongiactinospora gelatinilytica TaxID=2666298 RepID=A0A2W2H597_9ACTN|nr:hypothetical protein [Spongiactinospora gelatinilytica]PZG55652.1 hypothetical protein C1I98_02890 [Spongiactinospora gelatinilytica]
MDEIAARTRLSHGSLRYRRWKRDATSPPLWRNGRGLVAWASERDEWLAAERARDEAHHNPPDPIPA